MAAQVGLSVVWLFGCFGWLTNSLAVLPGLADWMASALPGDSNYLAGWSAGWLTDNLPACLTVFAAVLFMPVRPLSGSVGRWLEGFTAFMPWGGDAPTQLNGGRVSQTFVSLPGRLR